jgi:uncharacterized phiE125 gp8 family phage protein
MPSTSIITPATFEPVEVADVQSYLRIDTDDDSQFLERTITTCRTELERMMRMALCQQTFQSVLEFEWPPSGTLSGWLDWTSGRVEMPYPPLQAVISASIESLPGTWSVMDPATYYVDNISLPGQVWIMETAFAFLSLPIWTVWSEPFYPRLLIQHTSGYANPGLIPQEYKDMLMEMIGYKYMNREGSHMPAGTIENIRNRRIWNL